MKRRSPGLQPAALSGAESWLYRVEAATVALTPVIVLPWGFDAFRRPELYFELATTQLAAGNRSAAIEACTRCVRFHPSHIANIEDATVRAAVESRVFRSK